MEVLIGACEDKHYSPFDDANIIIAIKDGIKGKLEQFQGTKYVQAYSYQGYPDYTTEESDNEDDESSRKQIVSSIAGGHRP